MATERRDLGSVNPVLAGAVEARMLGRSVLVDPRQVNPKPSTSVLRAEQDLRAQAQRLRVQLTRSVQRLHVAPPNIRRVVDTVLALAQQPPLVDAAAGEIAPPELRAGWERPVGGLADPLSGQLRPLTFDPDVDRGRDNVVARSHLGHPLVAQATRLPRSAVWGGRTDLPPGHCRPIHTADRTGPARPGSWCSPAWSWSVPTEVGCMRRSCSRLARSPIPAAANAWTLSNGRTSNYTPPSRPPWNPPPVGPLRPQPENGWPSAGRTSHPAVEDVAARARTQKDGLAADLARQLDRSRSNTAAVFDQSRATLTSALQAPTHVQLSLDGLEPAERQPYDRDRRAWQDRLDTVEETRTRELALLERRYSDVRELVFPFAIVLAMPEDAG